MELNLPSDTPLGIWGRLVPSGFSTSTHHLGLQSSPTPSTLDFISFHFEPQDPRWVKILLSLKRQKKQKLQQTTQVLAGW